MKVQRQVYALGDQGLDWSSYMAAYSLSGKMRYNGDKDCEEGGLFNQSGREQGPQSFASNNISSLTDHRKIPFTKLA